MKKETRTTRLLSKKQGQRTVTLGMVVTLFAPLLLAPIANAEEVPASESTEVAQQLAGAAQTPENGQAVEAVITEEIAIEEQLPADTTEIVEETLPVEDTTELVAAETTTSENEAVQNITAETEESVLSADNLSAANVEVLADENWTPSPSIVAECQAIIAGRRQQVIDLRALVANSSLSGHELGEALRQLDVIEGYVDSMQQMLDGDGFIFESENMFRSYFGSQIEGMDSVVDGLMYYLGETSNPDIDVTGVSLSELPELTVGGTHQLVATITPTNAANTGVSYSSSNPSIVTVDANGLVTALSAGDYSITVTTADGGFTATVSGTVNEAIPEPEVPVDGITLSQTELSLAEGDSANLTATINPENATNKGVVWTVDNEAIATIDLSGNVTGIKEGTATITATTVDGEYTATCSIIVTKKPIIPPVDPVDPVDPKPEPTPDPKPLPTPSVPSLKDDPAQVGKNNGTVKPLGTVANPSIDLTATNNQRSYSQSQDSLPKAGEISTPTTLLGTILVGITTIGAFIFKRRHSH